MNQHPTQIDLRNELELLKEDHNTSAEGSQTKSFKERKITRSGTIFYLKAGSSEQEIKQRASFACDGQFIYMH